MCANMKAKHINIQKSHVSADPMYIFSENGSNRVSYLQIFPHYPQPNNPILKENWVFMDHSTKCAVPNN